MRLWCAPLINDRSGDPCGVWLEVYEDKGALLRAFSTISLAAAAIPADVFAFSVGLPAPGGIGSGGGARSGSELSHLRLMLVSSCIVLSLLHPAHHVEHISCRKGYHSHGHALSLSLGEGMLVPAVAVARTFPLAVHRVCCMKLESSRD